LQKCKDEVGILKVKIQTLKIENKAFKSTCYSSNISKLDLNLSMGAISHIIDRQLAMIKIYPYLMLRTKRIQH
jgi:hypothetical protein